MSEKLAVVVIGTRNSGKSTTWNELFGKTVKTGKKLRKLQIDGWNVSNIFLMSGSPEERKTPVEEIIGRIQPNIIVVSSQYVDERFSTINYLAANGYRLWVMWLNPGFMDNKQYEDDLGLVDLVLEHRGTICRLPSGDASARSELIRDAILGWAIRRDLAHQSSGHGQWDA